MRIFVLSIATLSLVSGTATSAKAVLQLDERCVARETLVCGQNRLNYMQYVAAMRGQNPLMTKEAGLASLVSLRQDLVKMFVETDNASINALKACEVFVRAAPDLCLVEVDMVTAEEVRLAIREGNEATLKAWLAALDAQRQE